MPVVVAQELIFDPVVRLCCSRTSGGDGTEPGPETTNSKEQIYALNILPKV